MNRNKYLQGFIVLFIAILNAYIVLQYTLHFFIDNAGMCAGCPVLFEIVK